MSIDVVPISFDVDGTRCVGDLRLPPHAGPHPLIILAHGLGGTRSMGLGAYAERFAAAGYAAMTFDYRGFGDSDGLPRQVAGFRRQHDDWRAAIDYGRTRPDIDASRIVLWGTSLSGGHVLTLAAERSDIAAVLAQCPFTDGLASSLTLGPASTLKVGVRAVADITARALRRPPVLVQTAGVRGSAALMTAPDALPGFLGLVDSAPGTRPSTTISAGFGLEIGRHRPGVRLRHISVPTLIHVCHPDTVAPHRATERHIAKAANSRIHSTVLDAGHFDVYTGRPFETIVSDQLAFVDEHVGT